MQTSLHPDTAVSLLTPAFYEHAAELLLNKKTGFACFALNMALGFDEDIPSQCDAHFLCFRHVFQPEHMFSDMSWWGDQDEPENREARIFGMLLMAELVRSEGTPAKRNHRQQRSTTANNRQLRKAR